MDAYEINFENLPKAIAFLNDQIAELKSMVENSKPSEKTLDKKIPIDIDAACQILSKAKPTVYTLVRTRKIPCYKSGKKLYFFEDELLEWIRNGKRKTLAEIETEASKTYRRISK
ncbi:helix-turn-helix domain-containing protein [uncultured Chryseobacterium sp.]|uniref:helix-turn-helix domain-containing protein n=1 Tax=uncultured Chryseobacterium sp. TaxID=259322 RepID=UPI0025E3B731|nr:helix-turn-helix domain-containing protein [uncultured Chryseobacterium sp.]